MVCGYARVLLDDTRVVLGGVWACVGIIRRYDGVTYFAAKLTRANFFNIHRGCKRKANFFKKGNIRIFCIFIFIYNDVLLRHLSDKAFYAIEVDKCLLRSRKKLNRSNDLEVRHYIFIRVYVHTYNRIHVLCTHVTREK